MMQASASFARTHLNPWHFIPHRISRNPILLANHPLIIKLFAHCTRTLTHLTIKFGTAIKTSTPCFLFSHEIKKKQLKQVDHSIFHPLITVSVLPIQCYTLENGKI